MHLLLLLASPFLPPQSQPKPSLTLSPSSASALSSLCYSHLCRNPRRTSLPPSSLPSHFYHGQALLFFITIGQPLPSSLEATAAPLCSARTLLTLSLQPPQPPPWPHPPLPPRYPRPFFLSCRNNHPKTLTLPFLPLSLTTSVPPHRFS
ncbi:hypothetical protein BHE74_00009422 [Ensete ventricosum]|nr:hypothetical protein BHE74_00009422 [Ensete ventricosum]